MRGLFLYLALSFRLDADKVSIDESAVEKQRARKLKKILIDFVVASELRSCVKKKRWMSWAPVPNSPYGLCGRKATLKRMTLGWRRVRFKQLGKQSRRTSSV